MGLRTRTESSGHCAPRLFDLPVLFLFPLQSVQEGGDRFVGRRVADERRGSQKTRQPAHLTWDVLLACYPTSQQALPELRWSPLRFPVAGHERRPNFGQAHFSGPNTPKLTVIREQVSSGQRNVVRKHVRRREIEEPMAASQTGDNKAILCFSWSLEPKQSEALIVFSAGQTQNRG